MAADRATRLHALPASLAPRGLNRVEAATYVGVSPTKFDAMVKDGRMPAPKMIDDRRVWDRQALDSAFLALPDAGATGGPGPAPAENDIWSRPTV